MIESAVTDLPEPDSPTTPSVAPGRSSRSTPSTARISPASVMNEVRRFSTFSSGASAHWRAGRPHGDVPLDRREHGVAVAGLHGLEQLAVLDRDLREVGRKAVAEEVGADPRRDAAPHLGRVRLAGAGEHELMEADVRLDQAEELAARAASAIVQTSFAISAKSASSICSSAFVKLKRSSVSRIGISTCWISSSETPSTTAPR